MEDEVEGGLAVDRKMEEKGHDPSGDLVNEHENTLICPVCRRTLNSNNLVDMCSIVEDNLYYTGGVLIINSKVCLHCDFQHLFDKGLPVDDPCQLVAVIDAVFDDKGKCVHFVVKEIMGDKG